MNRKISKSLVNEPPVWFITGCSTGFGLELAKQAIEQGFRTVMTARDPTKLKGYGATDKVLVLKLDVTQPDQVAAAVRASQARFGGVDVLVNSRGRRQRPCWCPEAQFRPSLALRSLSPRTGHSRSGGRAAAHRGGCGAVWLIRSFIGRASGGAPESRCCHSPCQRGRVRCRTDARAGYPYNWRDRDAPSIPGWQHHTRI